MTGSSEMCSLSEVYWAYVGFGRKDIDCRNFIQLCRDAELGDDNFNDDTAEAVFQQCMRLATRRLDLGRLRLALSFVAAAKGIDEAALHQSIFKAAPQKSSAFNLQSRRRSGSEPVPSPAHGMQDSGHHPRRHRSRPRVPAPSPAPPPTPAVMPVPVAGRAGGRGVELEEVMPPTEERLASMQGDLPTLLGRRSLRRRPTAPLPDHCIEKSAAVVAAAVPTVAGLQDFPHQDPLASAAQIDSLLLDVLDQGEPAEFPRPGLEGRGGSRRTAEQTFRLFCGPHKGLERRDFVRLCKQCCLVDGKFTALDAHMVFNAAVPVSNSRMNLRGFEDALARVAAKKGSKQSSVRKMVAWFEKPDDDEPGVAEHADVSAPEAKARDHWGISRSGSAPCISRVWPPIRAESHHW